MKFSSKLIEDAVDVFSQLPSVGKKSALRLVLHMVKRDKHFTDEFTKAISDLRHNIKECKTCHNLSDEDLCNICKDPHRTKNTLCVVESIRDVMAIEETGQFSGKYHVLGGVISPLEGIGLEELNIDTLVHRVQEDKIEELIMAISPTIDGDTTIYYITKKVEPLDVKVTTLARGISFGGELEYADGLTLGRSITSRMPYHVNSDI
ncbi:recombination mediator RecR [Saprospiraceae bacterium]|nr:recombination mediator RecR [Saprospiraceae bacterium]